MQFSTPLLQLVLVALFVVVGSTPVTDQDVGSKRDSEVARADEGTVSHVLTTQEMQHWLANTDAKLTFVGTPPNVLSTESTQSITVTYCSSRSQNVCGGSCTVYTGGAACLSAPGTVCLSATSDVAFCSGSQCSSPCNELASCGTHLNNGFCFTPGTKSIIVPTS